MCYSCASFERNRFCSVILIEISLFGIFYLHPLVKEDSVFSHETNMTYMADHSVSNRGGGACGWLIRNTLEG